MRTKLKNTEGSTTVCGKSAMKKERLGKGNNGVLRLRLFSLHACTCVNLHFNLVDVVFQIVLEFFVL